MKHWTAPTKRDDGFTVLELLVVITILGVLALISIPVFLNQKKKAIDTTVKSDMRQVVRMLEEYRLLNGTNGTNVASDLTVSNGGRMSPSPNTAYYVTYNDTTPGYCIIGRHANMTNAGTGNFIYYDSATRNFLPGTTSSSAVPSGALACDANRKPWSTSL